MRSTLPLRALLLYVSAFVSFPGALFAQAPHHGVDLTAIDPTVNPGDDFFHYATGSWIKTNEIPPDRAAINVFSRLADHGSEQVSKLIEDLVKTHPPEGTPARKIANLYGSYMDEKTIDARGLKPLEAQFAAINQIRTRRDLAHALGLTLRADVDALNDTNFHTSNLFGLWVAPGFNDPGHYVPYLLQGGLTLPDREFYLAQNPRMQSIRNTFRTHVSDMLQLAGFSQTDARADRILALETAIAQSHQSLADNQIIAKANNPWTVAEFSAKAPGLEWPEFFRAAGLAQQNSFMVWQPAAFTGEAALVASVPLDTWKDYLAYHLVESFAGVLPAKFADERFAFFGRTLLGAPRQPPRWQRGVALVDGELGDEVGKLYVQKYFTPAAKAKVEALVANLIAAFRARLDGLTWMAPSTRAEAQEKLSALNVSVGYPDRWRSYEGYDPKADDLIGNVQRGSLFDYHFQLARLGTPVDRREWCMEPQTVNAVNMPLHNALNFPAAILQPPFFDPDAPDAANYGAIGAIIGHEISHTFDSQGAAFDATGRVRNWWTPADLAHFEASTAALVAQYDRYAPFADLHVNGKQTLSENIADVAGLSAAYDGLHKAMEGQAAPAAGKFNADQQFFLEFAQNYEGRIRDNALRQELLTDAHAPGEYRADTVRNLDAWYAAFGVKPGVLLYLAPAARVRIW